MHEYTITESMLSLALEKAKEAKASRIRRINLVLGELSGVVSDCVQFYFEVIGKDTIASGAELAFEIRPTRLRCRSCETTFHPEDSQWSCPSCREAAVDIIAGRECYLESIEVE